MLKEIKVGEIWTQKYRFEPDEDEAAGEATRQWMDIKEGTFAASVANDIVPCRITYEKKEVNVVFVTVDARPSLPNAFDRADPNRFLNTEFQIVPAANVVDCTLSIDLGNTRTVALLVDHVGDTSENHGRLPVYQLPMHWNQCPAADQRGTFESVVSFICPDFAHDAFCGNQSRASFVKLGKFALWNNRAFGGSQTAGHYTLSSPKRYFWDKDMPRRDWIGAQYIQDQVESKQPVVKRIDGKMAKQLAADAKSESYRLPPAYILSAMVAEIYEQACFYVGSNEFKQLTNDDSCRRVSKVHVTYPSTLLPRELEEYQKQLNKGLTAYLHDYPTALNVTLSSEIDEASSVLSVYAYSEMRKSSALFWLQSIGRKSPLGYQARIAVIDVGGGTTDLSISSVEAVESEAGTDPFKASIDLVCRDGVNNAGDALMFEFIRTSIAKLGFESIWEASQVGDGALTKETFLTRYQSPENEASVRELTRNFWFDLAIRVAVECDELLRRYPDGNVDAADLHSINYRLNEDALRTWNRLFNANQGGVTIDVKEQMEVKITKDVFDEYLASADRIFKSVARSFATSIYAYDVDLLLFSGKTAEFLAVQNVFRKYVALPSSSIRSMKNFEVGTWCGHLTDANGRIADSKISTALGGALYSLRTDSSVNMSFHDHVSDLACKWGFVADNGPVAFTRPIFGDGELHKDVPLSGYRKLIARQMPFARTAILSYELRFKPGIVEAHHGLNGGSATVRLQCDPVKQRLSIENCSGTYADYTAVKMDDVECRICSMSGEFMMDKVVEI